MDRYCPGRAAPGVDISSLNLHAVRETANGAFLDLQDGNVERAVTALRSVLALQYPLSGPPVERNLPDSAEQPEPPGDFAVEWIHYDPNWRQFLGVTLALCEIVHGPVAPRRRDDGDQRCRRALRRRGTDGSNSALVHEPEPHARVAAGPRCCDDGRSRAARRGPHTARDSDGAPAALRRPRRVQLANVRRHRSAGDRVVGEVPADGRLRCSGIDDAARRSATALPRSTTVASAPPADRTSAPTGWPRPSTSRCRDCCTRCAANRTETVLPSPITADTIHVHDLYFLPLLDHVAPVLTPHLRLSAVDGERHHVQRFRDSVAESLLRPDLAVGWDQGRLHEASIDQYVPFTAHVAEPDGTTTAFGLMLPSETASIDIDPGRRPRVPRVGSRPRGQRGAAHRRRHRSATHRPDTVSVRAHDDRVRLTLPRKRSTDRHTAAQELVTSLAGRRASPPASSSPADRRTPSTSSCRSLSAQTRPRRAQRARRQPDREVGGTSRHRNERALKCYRHGILGHQPVCDVRGDQSVRDDEAPEERGLPEVTP